MNELHLPMPMPMPVPSGPADLAAGCARLAGRLAALLRSRLGEPDGLLARALAFLDRQAAASTEPSASRQTPMQRLIDAYGLAPIDLDLLLLAGLADEHEGYADIMRTLHPTGRPRPSVGLAAQLADDAGLSRERLRAALEIGPAVAGGLVLVEGDGPLPERDLLPAAGLWSRLHGIDLPPPGVVLDAAPLTSAGLDDWLAEPAIRRALAALRAGTALTIVATADDPGTAARRAAALVVAAGLTPLRVRLPAQPAPELIVRVGVHAIAAGRSLVLELDPGDGPGVPVPALPDHYPAPLLCGCRTGAEPALPGRALLRLAVERPGRPALARMWAELLPHLADSAPRLAAGFPLEPDQARRVVADLQAIDGERPPDLPAVAEAVRDRGAGRLGGGVQRIRPQAGWADLVLPERALVQLREAAARLTLQTRVLDEWQLLAGRRGARGVRLLLAGPSGTGKTLSAEVLAGALAVDLLLVDLSRVVSKWIGETEKNLAEVFATAEQARAVLLFDEADALFGKRTRVSDAHDRYANLETAYLLSRLERFDGLAALSTNLRQNIDSAFLRRLDFIIEYEAPDQAQRLALWECHLPPSAPRAADLDLAEIAAQVPLVGGLIRNAATTAAFMAAAEDRPIERAHVLSALRREHDKIGKPFRY
jgi:hypothetical protein